MLHVKYMYTNYLQTAQKICQLKQNYRQLGKSKTNTPKILGQNNINTYINQNALLIHVLLATGKA